MSFLQRVSARSFAPTQLGLQPRIPGRFEDERSHLNDSERDNSLEQFENFVPDTHESVSDSVDETLLDPSTSDDLNPRSLPPESQSLTRERIIERTFVSSPVNSAVVHKPAQFTSESYDSSKPLKGLNSNTETTRDEFHSKSQTSKTRDNSSSSSSSVVISNENNYLFSTIRQQFESQTGANDHLGLLEKEANESTPFQRTTKSPVNSNPNQHPLFSTSEHSVPSIQVIPDRAERELKVTIGTVEVTVDSNSPTIEIPAGPPNRVSPATQDKVMSLSSYLEKRKEGEL